VTKVER